MAISSLSKTDMNVSLTPYLEALIKEKVSSGRYNSSSEVVREALRLLDEKDKRYQLELARIREKVQIGTDQLDAGLGEEWDMDRFLEEAERRYQEKKKSSEV